MQQACLHLPVDFEMRSEVRKLALACRREGGEELARLAALFVVRLWTEWAREGVDWRPLDRFAQEAGGIDWERESITTILEDYCGWPGERGRGGMVRLYIEAGVLGVESRGGLQGLVLRDFWRYNEHLSPAFLTIQQIGGRKKAERQRQKQLDDMAGQQARLLQGTLVFPETKPPSLEELRQATGLVMRIDRAAGAAVRATSEYSEALVECAVEVVRHHGKEAITAVERYIHAHRDDTGVVKVAERVIEKFDDYLARAGQP